MLLGKSAFFKEKLATNKTEARMALFGLYLVMLLPFAMVIARVGAEITMDMLGLLFLYRSYRFKDWEWVKQAPILIALALWFYSVLIVTPLAVDPAASLRRVDWARYILLFAAIVYWLSDYHEELRKMALVILGLLLLAGADAIYQYVSGFSLAGQPYIENRLTGPFHKMVIGIYTAKFCLPLIGITLYYAWVEKKQWLKFIAAAVLVFCFSVVMLSNERTATITLAIGILVAGTGLFIGFKRARPPIIGILLLCIVGIYAAYQSQPSLQNRVKMTQEIMQDFPNSQYAQLWKASILMWQQHPATGVGMVNFRVVCPQLQEQGKVNFCATHSHNMYLEVLSEMGSIGFTLILLLVLSIAILLVEQHSSRPRERIILTCFAAGGLILNFFPLAPTQSFFSNWPAMLAWQSVAWSIAIVKGGMKEPALDD